jgi:hypothetical protein
MRVRAASLAVVSVVAVSVVEVVASPSVAVEVMGVGSSRHAAPVRRTRAIARARTIGAL